MNKDYLTPKEAEEYYQTLRDAKAFQKGIGIMAIILGLAIVGFTGIGEGFLFVLLGLYVALTKEILVPLPREEEE